MSSPFGFDIIFVYPRINKTVVSCFCSLCCFVVNLSDTNIPKCSFMEIWMIFEFDVIDIQGIYLTNLVMMRTFLKINFRGEGCIGPTRLKEP